MSKIGSYQDSRFQDSVLETDLMYATASAGAPGSGQFYSSITGRAPIVDLRKDLKARMGIERIMSQQIYEIQNEFGPSGEKVWGSLNDDKGLIRFVGAWTSGATASGLLVQSTVATDFIEITFYGTGLNLLQYLDTGNRSITVSYDGGSTTVLNSTTSNSPILGSRNCNANSILNVFTSLSLGVHTVKILANGAATILISGFEVLNESSYVKTNPGTTIVSGSKRQLLTQDSTAYSTFESGTSNGRGGRVIKYLKTNGTIGAALNPTNASAAYMSSANHTNEEIIRVYSSREFGAGRNATGTPDDFSLEMGTARNRAFTLDDGTTTLVAQAANFGSAESFFVTTTNDFVVFTFVGTGLDIVTAYNFPSGDQHTVYIDGSSVGTIVTQIIGTIKITSGLPFGTHTAKFIRNANTGYGLAWGRFIVYGPKKPIIPSGAIELSDTFLMATYVANSTAALDTIATGVLRKSSTREFTYVNGTGGSYDWSAAMSVSNDASGWLLYTNRTGYFEYTFVGTGFEMRFQSAAGRSTNIQVSLQNLSAGGLLQNATTTNFPTMVSSAYGTGIVFTASTGILDEADASAPVGAGMTISNLPFGTWKVRFTNNSAGSDLVVDALDIITPIYSPKSNIYGDLQNTLPVGSNSLGDSRKTTPIKDVGPAQKAWAQAVGVTSGPTSSSTSAIPFPDMSLTIKTSGGALALTLTASVSNTLAANVITQFYVDGSASGPIIYAIPGAGLNTLSSLSLIVPVTAGVHKVDVFWYTNNGTMSCPGVARILTAKEM